MQEWNSEGIGFFLARQLVGVFEVEEWQVDGPAARVRGRLLTRPETALSILRERLEPSGFMPLLSSEREIRILPVPLPTKTAARDRPWIQILLFVATVFTTLLVGALHAGVNPFADPGNVLAGFPFSLSLLSILLVHEMGHYFTARRYGVQVSLPYFIPAPPPVILGTFGALIKMRSPIVDRRSLFDIGIAGPIAGLCLAIPVTVFGLTLSEIVPVRGDEGIFLGSSLLFRLIQELTLGHIPKGMDVLLHPVGFAGWIGFLVTALNLLPLGQLDGGHIAYALLGRRSEKLALFTAITLLIMGVAFWPGWLLWAFLAFMLGFKHPPPLNDVTPLDPARRVIAFGAFILLLFLITPAPFASPEF
jgi:membrane-associated protease RseP (regulator of RpoE activity)